MRKLGYLLFFLCIGGFLHAQRLQYDCRGCTLSVDDQKKFQVMAEYETDYFSEIFGAQRSQTIRIRMYGDEKKFLAAQRRLIGRVISESGMYAPLQKLVLVYKWPRYMATTYHEMSHAIFHQYARFRPTWIDEGIAEYFKMAVIDSMENITIAPHIFRSQQMRTFVSDSAAFTIRPTINAGNRKFHQRRETSYYSVSWGIVYFLRTQHDDIFSSVLYKLGTGKRSEKTLEEEYPGGIAQLEKDMIRFYKQPAL